MLPTGQIQRHRGELLWRVLMISVVLAARGVSANASAYTLIGWNNLGMHCMDADYSVFSLLPPYNTIQAQLIDSQGTLVRDSAGITVTYEAVADPAASINTTSAGKTNFWQFVDQLFGVAPVVDTGLTGTRMPGAANSPQPMSFDAASSWFIAEGIPIVPRDDKGNHQSYPLMRLIARDSNATVLATTDIVLPVSDEMDCRSCHASNSSPSAQPAEGWVNDPNAQRDMRLNILRLHDDRERDTPAFQSALAAAGYDPSGLFATAATDGTPVLCARCHASAALSGSGLPGVEPLTQAVHRRMASVVDPTTGTLLNDSSNRSACYRCHPGAVTRCLRGVMGNAVAADGTRAIQCQSCHGSMLDVAAPTRAGWLDEPLCQSCHTGTAVNNNGQIRYLSVFDASGQPRVAGDPTFATTPDTPSNGHSLYRFSTGHGGLECAACHGSTHAEFPSAQPNDNLQSIALQGHVGVLAECTACHASVPNTVNGGPHGMHPVGQVWVDQHPDLLDGGDAGGGHGATQCQVCHGSDYRGTELSRAQADRVLNTSFGVKQIWRGFQIGCYTCHNGPSGEGEHGTLNTAPQVNDTAATTSANTPVTIPLSGTDTNNDPLTLRIVSQPSHGTAGLNGTLATFYPDPEFSGTDSFTYAAWDGSTDSNLATVSVLVNAAVATPSASATPTASAAVSGCVGDCDGSGSVSVDGLVGGVDIALGNVQLADCKAFDCNHTGLVTIDCLVQAVNAALNGCGTGLLATATPTPTPTPTQPSSPVPTATGSTNPDATLAKIQTNIFSTTCTDAACHSSLVQAGNLVLEAGQSYAQLVNVPAFNFAAQQAGLVRVKPGDPSNSFLIVKLTGPPPVEGSAMPLGKAPLTAVQIQAIRDWITAGAPP